VDCVCFVGSLTYPNSPVATRGQEHVEAALRHILSLFSRPGPVLLLADAGQGGGSERRAPYCLVSSGHCEETGRVSHLSSLLAPSLVDNRCWFY